MKMCLILDPFLFKGMNSSSPGILSSFLLFHELGCCELPWCWVDPTWQRQALLKKQVVFKNKLTQGAGAGLLWGEAPQDKVQVCCGKGGIPTWRELAMRSWGAMVELTAEICWEDVVSDRTKTWWLTQPRASHSYVGLLMLVKVPQVSWIKSKGRQRRKNSDKTFVLISLEFTVFIKPPPASGWDCILLRIVHAIFKICLALFVQDIPFKEFCSLSHLSTAYLLTHPFGVGREVERGINPT